MSVYCLDSNIFIQAWNNYYSPDLCPNYWTVLDQLASDRQIFCCEEVRREIERQDDDLCAWLRTRPHFVDLIDGEIQGNVSSILTRFPRLVDSRRDRSMADPWVIAHAMARDAVVVTKEMPAGRAARVPKIPDVCRAFEVPWMDDFQLARELGIRFTASRIDGEGE